MARKLGTHPAHPAPLPLDATVKTDHESNPLDFGSFDANLVMNLIPFSEKITCTKFVKIVSPDNSETGLVMERNN